MTETSHETHVLVVDDDDAIRDLLCDFLHENQLSTHQAANHAQMWQVLQQKVPDVVILDINMPQRNGIELCRELRESPKYHSIPIIMLTARSSSLDTIMGLETGADDYVAKPFEPLELLSRIRSVVRRSRMAAENSGKHAEELDNGIMRFIAFNEWTLDIQNRTLIDKLNTSIPLSNAEFKFLRFMLLHANRPLSRDQLMEEMHGREAGPFDRSIDLQISRIRQKVEVDSKNPTVIKTLRNEGYLLTADVRYLK
ncbi:response regulator [Methylophilus luteus]|uniref:Response regulator n=1 Tax=Methylophilus luteus TaxID=640108 RepID=A0ABW3F380_9PROT